jgi:hypothetical protein
MFCSHFTTVKYGNGAQKREKAQTMDPVVCALGSFFKNIFLLIQFINFICFNSHYTTIKSITATTYSLIGVV